MKIYLVGGAVRDQLLGLPPGDRDWVVIGATPQALGAAGFVPVGRDFPVFLHPQTHEEYALARVERKTAAGYHGFAFHTGPDVTLEEDLARRDLTINAMAQDESGQVIDPWGGRKDLQNKVLRHVSAAFSEDPVRILRLARFLARYTEFTVAPETQQLCCDMVTAGEVDALVPERVWQELSRGLMEAKPSRMVVFLEACGAWSRVVTALPVHAEMLRRIDTAAQRNADLPVRFAVLTLPTSSGGDSSCAAAGVTGRLGELSQALRVPVQCGELAELLSRERGAVEPTARGGAQALVAWFDRCDVWRRAERFDGFLQACACDGVAQADLDRLVQAWTAARAVVSAEVTAQALAQGLRGPAVGQALFNARVTSVRAVWGEAAA